MWQGGGRGRGGGRGGRNGNGTWKGNSKGGGSYRYDQDRPSEQGGRGNGGRGSFGGNGGGSGKGGGKGGKKWSDRPYDPRTPSEKNAEVDRIDAIFGYEKLDKTASAGKEYLGWMTNMRQLVVEDEDGGQRAACEYYFIAPDGTGFKVRRTRALGRPTPRVATRPQIMRADVCPLRQKKTPSAPRRPLLTSALGTARFPLDPGRRSRPRRPTSTSPSRREARTRLRLPCAGGSVNRLSSWCRLDADPLPTRSPRPAHFRRPPAPPQQVAPRCRHERGRCTPYPPAALPRASHKA
eukprot:scaffold1810_cov96-Isochrysis_galbana.AAC.5